MINSNRAQNSCGTEAATDYLEIAVETVIHELAEASRPNQRGRIMRLLVSARGDWVPLPKLAQCAAQYGARIFELRRLGFRITNKTRDVDGERHSWFRLESTAPAPATKLQQHKEPAPRASADSFPEFGDLAPERYPD